MESKTIFVTADQNGTSKEAMEILNQEGVPVKYVSTVPDPVPDDMVVISSETPPAPSRFPGSHIRIRPELRTVYVRHNDFARNRSGSGFQTAIIGMISIFDPDLYEQIRDNKKKSMRASLSTF